MSWTQEKESLWAQTRKDLQEEFDRLSAEYLQIAQREGGQAPVLPALQRLEAAMTGIREKISRLIFDMRGALDTVREKTGEIEAPVKDLEADLQHLKAQESTLKLKKTTREQQVDALANKLEANRHTIWFLMNKPLANPSIVLSVALTLLTIGGYMNYQAIRQFFIQNGIIEKIQSHVRMEQYIPSLFKLLGSTVIGSSSSSVQKAIEFFFRKT